MPLADLMRPTTLDEVAGQRHLLDKNAPFRRIIESGNIPSMVFYGPPGIGKTTVADIVASSAHKLFHKLNATNATLSDIRETLASADTLFGHDGILLYIDEIQYFNKKQQQSLLEYMEDGRVTLICSTTENPYFCIYNALLSRSTVFEFKHVLPNEIIPVLKRGLERLNEQYSMEKTADERIFKLISHSCGGDVRKALGMLENTFYASPTELSEEAAKEFSARTGLNFDKDGDSHYDLLSALQKSIRGSDENAAIYYLARLLEGGDLLSACRRLLVIASEDIALAYPLAAVVTKSCVDSALQLGLPEARIPLAHATVLLATAPKSNSSFAAYTAASYDLGIGDVPGHLKDAHYSGAESFNRDSYIYPHSYPGNYVKQQYLPDELKNKIYYRPGNNKNERASKEYWDKIKSEAK